MQIYQLILLVIIFTNVIAHLSRGIAEENIQLDHQIPKKENDVHKIKTQDSDQLTKTVQVDQIKATHQDDQQGINTLEINEEIKAHNPDQEIKAHNADQEIKAHNPDQEIKAHNADQEIKAHNTDQEIKAHKADQEIKAHNADQGIKAHNTDQGIKAHHTEIEQNNQITQTEKLANGIAKELILIDSCGDEQKKIFRKREDQQENLEYFLRTTDLPALLNEAKQSYNLKLVHLKDDKRAMCSVNFVKKIKMEENKGTVNDRTFIEDLLKNVKELLENHQNLLPIRDEKLKTKLAKLTDIVEIKVNDELANAIADGFISREKCKEGAKKYIKSKGDKLVIPIKKLIDELIKEETANQTIDSCLNVVLKNVELKHINELWPELAGELGSLKWTNIGHGLYVKKMSLEVIEKMLKKIEESSYQWLIIKDAKLKEKIKQMDIKAMEATSN